jgi:hypothetical protein
VEQVTGNGLSLEFVDRNATTKKSRFYRLTLVR